MLRTAGRLTPTLIPIFSRSNPHDYDKLQLPKPEGPETGWDRVKKMYSMNEYEEVSHELHNVIQSSLCGALVGACLGGFVQTRNAYLYFIENNQATIFKTPAAAKKKLQDYVTIAFCKGAYQWGWRLSIFTGMFSLIATTASVYRGDTSLVDFITAGAITGALYKVNLGLAATLVGAGLGAALSTIGGAAILGVLKVTGVSMADIRKALYMIKESREETYKEAVAKSCEIMNDPLTKHHEQVVQERGAKRVEELQ